MNENSQVHDLTEKPEFKEIPAEYEEVFYHYDDVNFANPCRTRKVENYYIQPQGGFTNVNIPGQALIFEVNETSGYLRMSEAYFLCTFTIKARPQADAAGPADVSLAPALNVTLENDFFWKLFIDARLEINSQTIEQLGNVSKMSSMIGKCLYSKTFKDVGGIAYGWAPDNGPAQAATVPADDTNWGFNIRKNYYNIGGAGGASQTIAKLKPVFGFCEWDKVLYGVNIRLTLTRSTEGTGTGVNGVGFEQLLFGSAVDLGAKIFTFNIESIQLVIPRYIPIDTEAAGLLARYSLNHPIPVRFLRRFCISKGITASTDSWQLGTASTNMSSSYGIPKFVLLGFKNTVSSCIVCDDGFIFPKVKSLRLAIGAEYYPVESMRCDVNIATGKSRCVQAYDAYANFCWKMGNEPTMSINHFRLYDAIFCFDCTAHTEMIGGIAANISMDMEFYEDPVNIKAYVIIFSDARFVINTDNGRMSQITFS